METIEIGFDNLEPINLNFNDIGSGPSKSSSSVNFGPGVELLMNNSRKSSESNNVNFDLNELDSLEKELNELSGSSSSSSNVKKISTMDNLGSFTSNLFGFGSSSSSSSSSSPPQQENEENQGGNSNLGNATKDFNSGNTKTWDGFTKYNDIPSDNGGESYSSSSKLNEREKRRKKRAMIKKLEEWYEKGLVKNITHFNIDSPFEEVEDEYETALEDKRKKDSIKLQGWWFLTFVNSIEYANAAFNPFDINLDGWGEQISEDMDSYEDIFTELHEKYKGGKLSPELSLLLRLGFSAAVVNFTNKALSSATPGFNDVIKQSPELMKMFTNATVNSMSQQSPGFAFASNMMNNPEKINTAFGPPPPPMETKNMPAQARPGMQFTHAPSNRQDINIARGAMFQEQGVDLNNNYGDANRQERSFRTAAQPMQLPPQQQQQQQQNRPEMRGPQNSDIENILSGLKTKPAVEKPNPIEQMFGEAPQQSSYNSFQEDDSMISISSLKDLQNTNMPKRVNRRKNKSDKNIISLDI